MNRREFGLAAAALAAPVFARAQSAAVPEVIRQLHPMTDGIQPITDQERNSRMEKARRLMRENQIDAIFLEGNTSTYYFTGTRWGASERTFGLVFPARGELGWVVPGFEEARARELIRFGTDIRTWEEDESPYRKIVGILKDRGISTGRVGIEEQVRFFVFNGIRKEGAAARFRERRSGHCRLPDDQIPG